MSYKCLINTEEEKGREEKETNYAAQMLQLSVWESLGEYHQVMLTQHCQARYTGCPPQEHGHLMLVSPWLLLSHLFPSLIFHVTTKKICFAHKDQNPMLKKPISEYQANNLPVLEGSFWLQISRIQRNDDSHCYKEIKKYFKMFFKLLDS